MPSIEAVKKEDHSSVPNLEYVSIGCNRTPHALDWSKHGLIAFGAGNSVAIYDPKPHNSAGKIKFLLNKHTGKVNCVSWLSSTEGTDTSLVSGSVDTTICIWRKKEQTWMLSQQLTGHASSIHALAATSYNGEENQRNIHLLASSAADSNVIVWKSYDKEDYEAIQTISFGNGFALSLSMTVLPSSNTPLLACGCDDSKIHLHAKDKEHFKKVETLQGHEDWIQSIDFSSKAGDDIFMASGSKDSFIRIWKICLKKDVNLEKDELKLEEQKILVDEKEYTIVLESVVSGHDGWVNGVRWKKPFIKGEQLFQPMVVLSASMDKTMMIWELDYESGVWLDVARMGEVGGNTLGFYGCDFSPDGASVIAHGFQGAFHLWKKSDDERWIPDVTVSGHFGPAQDFEWDPVNGEFLISVSTDQTARLHAPWRQEGKELTWHEVARPQVHGYDMQCIACLNRGTYVSGSEEKVIRAFRAPKSFFESLSAISKVTCDNEATDALPVGASIPALGLSNKAVFRSDLDSWKDDSGNKSQPMKASTFASEDPAPYTPIAISAPPPEDILLQNTLWPEVHKLYGHGFEIFCLASNPQGTVLASACKASKAEFANILLWDTKTWMQIGSLAAHSLTVTQLSFSNDGHWLLSVSRDRTWALFQKNKSDMEGSPYVLAQKTTKNTCMHTRIIWSCCWTHDDKYFLTSSRDKKVIAWGERTTDEGNWGPASKILDVGEPATAISASSYCLADKRYIIAVGKESGCISLYTWNANCNEWSHASDLNKSLCPTLTVKRLRWNKHRLPTDSDQNFQLQLAACSNDSSLRILNIPISSFSL